MFQDVHKRPVAHATTTFAVAVATAAWLAQAAAQVVDRDYRSWARTEPVAVVDFLSRNPQARTPEILAAAIGGWVEGDPAAAFARIPTVYESLTFRVVSAFVDRWAAQDPSAVAAALDALGPKDGTGGRLREAVGEIVGRRWTEQAPDAAIAWAIQPGHPAAWGGVLETLVRTNPERALDLASGMPNPRMRETYIDVTVAEIATRDPVAAAAYLQRAGLPAVSVHAAGKIMKSWLAFDRATAEQWALGLPAGEGRDVALADAVTGTLDAARAADLVNQIQTERFQVMAVLGWIDDARRRGDGTQAEFESRLLLSPAARQLATRLRSPDNTPAR